ncbi:acyl-CoA dehydrogenase family protein [Eisenibacter elegans]|uniref:acyl-CoA dehydrogenase family protein n=1 Tax=Eisenibacter elegans TaxID=997 RepID=UPI000416547F|nr:acyl-CoA dehydrogenase family protein [Eisenibacter elegans]
MDAYYFNEEHRLFREGVRQFLAKEVIPHVDQWEKDGRVPKELWLKFGEMGYLGLNFPEEYGGMDADFWYSVVFLEELARCFSGGLAIIPTAHQYMALPYIAKVGSEFLKDKYLRKGISGEWLSSIAITEPSAGSDAAAIKTTARREGDYYIVNGSKTFITNGVYGDFLITVVKTNPAAGSAGVSLLVIDRHAEGVSANKLNKLGWHASDTAELFFENVKVPVENLIGEEGKGFYYLMGGLQLERLAGAVAATAASDFALKYALEYMGQREAFGRTINKFQALRHRVADMAAEIESTKYFVYHACRMHSDGHYAVKEASMAKLLATELSDKTMYKALQFFGGYGFIEDYKIARMFRDSRVGTIGGGSSEIMREIIAKMVIDDVQYDSAIGKPKADKPVYTAAQIMEGLPKRFKSEKAAQYEGVFHFDLQGEGGGQFTVVLSKGDCRVESGLHGSPNCVLQTEAGVYVAVETGQINAQEAFMSGKIKASNPMEMMTFGGLFKKL